MRKIAKKPKSMRKILPRKTNQIKIQTKIQSNDRKPNDRKPNAKNKKKVIRHKAKYKPKATPKSRPITRSMARRLNYNHVKIEPKLSSHILNDDVLKIAFKYLSLRDKFRAQRTSKQFRNVLQELLQEQCALRIGNIADYYDNCRDERHSTKNCDIEDAIVKKYFYKYFYMNDITASKDQLANIFWKCPNIKCLELHNFQIDVDTIKWIKWHCPLLECLRMDEIKYDFTSRKWTQV